MASLSDLPLNRLVTAQGAVIAVGIKCNNMSALSPDMYWYGRGDSDYMRETSESGNSFEGLDVMGGSESENVILATNDILMKKLSDKKE